MKLTNYKNIIYYQTFVYSYLQSIKMYLHDQICKIFQKCEEIVIEITWKLIY